MNALKYNQLTLAVLPGTIPGLNKHSLEQKNAKDIDRIHH